MSDVPQQRSEQAKTLDFTGVTVLGLPGGAGIISINGDATPAQSLSALSPGFVSNNGIGGHVVSYLDFVPAVPGPSAAGLVPNPGAAGATDYLAADATFKPIPVIPPAITFSESVAGVSPPIGSGPPWTPTLCSLTGLVAGIYLFIGELFWGLGLANGDYGTSIQLNGTPIAEVDNVFVSPNALPFGQSCSVVKAGIVPLDVITLQGYQQTGGPVSPVATLTFLQAVKIA